MVALRYHNVYGPGMPRDTPVQRGGGDLPVGAGGRPAHPGCSRTAGSGATSSTSATWPGPTWRRVDGDRTGPGFAGVQRRLGPARRPWARWRARWPTCGRAGAGGDRRVPARRRAARGRLAGPGRRGAGLPRRDRPGDRGRRVRRTRNCAGDDRGADPSDAGRGRSRRAVPAPTSRRPWWPWRCRWPPRRWAGCSTWLGGRCTRARRRCTRTGCRTSAPARRWP